MQSAHIIVGGGLAGLFSARVLIERGYSSIVVVEKSPKAGGLLQHIVIENPLEDGRNFCFDQGTHFVLEPNDPNLRQLMQADISLEEYTSFNGSLQEAHILNGRLYQQSGCPFTGSLNSEIQQQIKDELEALHQAPKSSQKSENFYEECIKRYGHTATDIIYKPAYEKFTGMALNALDVSMGNFFAPGRLIVDDQENSIALKKDPDWDWRIAFSDCNDSASDIVKYYPRTGGIGYWLETMTLNLQKNGVRILTDTTIDQIETEDVYIKNITLSSGEKLECEKLIWSLPAIFLAIQTSTDVPSKKPVMRQVSLVHLLLDRRPIERPHWITVYDQNLLSYRITLYDNFTSSHHDVSRITVEILHDGELNKEGLEDKVFAELKTLGIVPPDTQKLWAGRANKPQGFPVLSASHRQTYIKQNQILEQTYNNLVIVGRRPDTGGGQLDIMNHIWNTLK